MEAFILQFVLLFPVCLGWVAINGDRWFRSACIGGRDASIIPAQLSLLKSSRGGFGGDDKSRKLKERGTTKKKVSGKMKGRLAELTNDPGKDTRAGLQSSGERPQFDRFGLPILTERELFPPIPPETPITAAAFKEYQGEVQITQEALVEILADNLQLNFSALKRCRGGEGIKVRILHRSPPVLAIDNFFTAEECQECKFLVESGNNVDSNKMNSVVQVNSATFSALAQSKRTSTTWYCYYSQMSTLLAKVKAMTGIALEQCEEPQIVRYRTGEQFSWHYDEVPGPQLDNGGQRIATLILYLNTVHKGRGGATIFRDLKDPNGKMLSVQPKKGSLLIFFPACANGKPDDRTLHKSDVAIDEKVIAQMWIHQRSYSAAVPKSNTQRDAKGLIAAKERELGFPYM